MTAVFDAPGLAVSIPASELAADPPPGSIYGWQHLAAARITDDLRVAVDLVGQACRARNLPLVFIARPEVFTNSASLAWLRDQLKGVENHLCISDGMAIRIVPRMRNHVFLYRQGLQANTDSFVRLMRRAPELISTMRAQVNTAYGVCLHQQRVVPPTLLIAGDQAAPSAETRLYPFYLDRRSAAQSASVSLGAGVVDPGRLAQCRRIFYCPLTEVAARDRGFAGALADRLLQAYFDPTVGVVLRLPWLAAPAATAAERIAVALAGLCAARAELPRVVADNIVYTPADADADWLCGPDIELHLVAHEAFDFWRHSARFYAKCQTMTVYAPWRRRGDRHGMRAVLGGLLGRRPDLCWLPRDDPHDP